MLNFRLNEILKYSLDFKNKCIYINLLYKQIRNEYNSIILDVDDEYIKYYIDYLRMKDRFINILLNNNYIIYVCLYINIKDINMKTILINNNSFSINYFFLGNNNVINDIIINDKRLCYIFLSNIKLLTLKKYNTQIIDENTIKIEF